MGIHSMMARIELDKVYMTVRETEEIQLGWFDPDFGEMVSNGSITLREGEIYEFTREANDDNVYSYEQDGKVLRSPLASYFKRANMIIFPIKSVLEEYIAKYSE